MKLFLQAVGVSIFNILMTVPAAWLLWYAIWWPLERIGAPEPVLWSWTAVVVIVAARVVLVAVSRFWREGRRQKESPPQLRDFPTRYGGDGLAS